MKKNWKRIRSCFVSLQTARQFTRNDENRKVTQAHVNEVKQECRESFETMPSVAVNLATGHIIDGQHRCEAYIQMCDGGELPVGAKLPVVYYDIPADEEMDAVRMMNSNQKRWALKDYIESYVTASETDERYRAYAVLDGFCRDHALTMTNSKPTYRYALAMINGGKSNGIEKGRLQLTDEEIRVGDTIHGELCEIVKTVNKDLIGAKFWIEPMAIVWRQHRDLYPFSTWASAFKARRAAIKKMPMNNQKQWTAIVSEAVRTIEKQRKTAE